MACSVRITNASELDPGATVYFEDSPGPAMLVLDVLQHNVEGKEIIIVADLNGQYQSVDIMANHVREVKWPYSFAT